MKKRLTVTIGIPAYNEEANIGRLLRALIRQRTRHIHIGEILVFSDGSTDGTVRIARSIKNHRIRVIDDPVRRGKPYRINQIFQSAKGDAIILLDADGYPVSPNTIERFFRPFLTEKFRGLVGGPRKAVPSRSLTGIALTNYHEAFGIARNQINNGNNIHNFFSNLALHSNFARSIHIPLDCPGDDNYIYLTAKLRGVPIVFVPDAEIWHVLPQTVRDQISQGSRFLASRIVLEKYFDKDLLDREFFVPFRPRLHVLLYQVRKNVFAYLWLKYLTLICQMKRSQTARTLGGTWTSVQTTKKYI